MFVSFEGSMGAFQWAIYKVGPLLVISGVITPINGLINRVMEL